MTLLNVADQARTGELVETLPVSWYTDPAILDIEKKHIFARTWQYVGPVDSLKKKGDYFTTKVVDTPIIVTKSADGINAIVNVCRHRFHEVASGSGNTRRFSCPYHAWSYDLSGNLCAAPREDMFDGFDKSAYPLKKLPVAVWSSMIFVSLDHDVEPFDSYVAPLEAVLTETGVNRSTLKFRARKTFEIRGNWKTAVENFLECYHCTPAHPAYAKTFEVNTSTGYPFEVNGAACSARTLPQERFREDPQSAPYNMEGDIKVNQNDFLWPNFMTVIWPGGSNFAALSFTPVSADETLAHYDYFMGDEIDEDTEQKLVKFFNEVGEEDLSLIESVHRGMRSGEVATGVLVPDEGQVAAFQKMIGDVVRHATA
ncbi:aromatic ring-hydroxylating oxygenase subunit alpha [Amycolatopsis methanolica]|uniref:Oxidoreductase n=1 Tax=Amycolatopsis methanolica 239 TaxID=1068978 RepID=A0A076MYA5_AMYME|nr:aromatic ring-hydroxylating dioxygenase subunit alpha [Amycolatopsis methanolica]AIJ26124.1 oxidoreductase [Amycolatopsis methanolica 239]